MEIDSGNDQEAGSSSQAPGIDLSGKTRGAWRGSDVTQHEIDWLRRSRRIPEGVSCRLPGDEIEPVLNPGEFVVFLAHFERGFGLPASDFFRQFLDFYRLQPHHLPGNAVFYLSCYVSFMEAYIGIRPTRETFARFFSLRINSVQGKEIPKPKPPVQCGSCIIGSRQGSPFFKFTGLESCRLWQTTFFYVKNEGAADFINLPAFNPVPPTKVNWGYFPGTNHIETNRVVRFMEKLMRETNICSDDIIRAFISRLVLPLKRRAHKMSEMYGPDDPTKITGLPLSKADAKDRFRRIESDKRGPVRKRPLDKVDPDPYVHWTELKMGHTNVSRLGNVPPEASGSVDDLTVLEVHEHVAPLQDEVGQEFLDKLASGSKRNKAPAPDAVLRFRSKALRYDAGGLRGTARTSSPPCSSPVHLGTGSPSASPLEGAPSAGRVTPTTSDHRAEDDFGSPPDMQDAGASNIGADPEASERAEPQVPPVQKEKKKKKKSSRSSPSKAVPDFRAGKLYTTARDSNSGANRRHSDAAETPVIEPTHATPTPPPSSCS
ncbi:hypothetical protein QYE76_004793 [Lolium multiflorum]|uniref:Transposase (putative) gypsy type domain-containing protein n=1 Tax=Lolium multiflorum TaxID=4521 RepID=A0AAD8RRD7_LOLMU|nr:hypothetical protein QYE76_004793 [Lolium multiflorum]